MNLLALVVWVVMTTHGPVHRIVTGEPVVTGDPSGRRADPSGEPVITGDPRAPGRGRRGALDGF